MSYSQRTYYHPLAIAAFSFLITLAGLDGAVARGEQPGRFDYLTLALSWSPTYCANNRNDQDAPQCSGPRPYAFVLHGLWPQYERGWPEFCRTKKRPWVPKKVMQSMLDIMPSKKLIIHQYRKHGTCSGLSAQKFFRASRALYKRVKIPARFVHPKRPIRITPDQIEQAFLKANPKLRPEHVAVVCGRRHRLREVRICFTPKGAYRTCTLNEDQRKLCRSKMITLPPVRQGRGARSWRKSDRTGEEATDL